MVTEDQLKSGELLSGLDGSYWTAVSGTPLIPAQCADSAKFK